jgi:SAM-dependent methyltransferase
VIEHVFDPIGTLVHAHRKLRPGGKLVLVVPDKNRTFDRERPITTLGHLIEDYNSPDPSRDFTHYEEFYRLAFKTSEEDLNARASAAFAQRGDLHVHVWDYPSFSDFVNYVNDSLVSWSSIWSHPTLKDESRDIEFYFLLTK